MAYKESLFIDSSYFCALYNKNDSLYNNATTVTQKLNNYFLYTSNFVLLEIYTVLAQRINKKTSVKFGKLIQNQDIINVVYVTQKDEKQFWDIFKSINNKNISYVDVSSLYLLQKLNISNILTYDQHFKPYQKQYNFKILN